MTAAGRDHRFYIREFHFLMVVPLDRLCRLARVAPAMGAKGGGSDGIPGVVTLESPGSRE
jgi:hypothetical protein